MNQTVAASVSGSMIGGIVNPSAKRDISKKSPIQLAQGSTEIMDGINFIARAAAAKNIIRRKEARDQGLLLVNEPVLLLEEISPDQVDRALVLLRAQAALLDGDKSQLDLSFQVNEIIRALK